MTSATRISAAPGTKAIHSMRPRTDRRYLKTVPSLPWLPASRPSTFNLLSERFTGQCGSAIRRLALGDGRDNRPVTLDKLTQRLRDFAAARDWEPFHTPKNLVMALSGEVGELTALFQWLTPEEAQQWRSDPELEANVRDEIADVTLYLVRLADMLGVDLLEAANAKVDRNELRFPPLDRTVTSRNTDDTE